MINKKSPPEPRTGRLHREEKIIKYKPEIRGNQAMVKKIGKVRVATIRKMEDVRIDEWWKIETKVLVNGEWRTSQNVLNQKFINSENGIYGRFS